VFVSKCKIERLKEAEQQYSFSAKFQDRAKGGQNENSVEST